ncbi:MAG: D-sedoheptulose 7-phosphate isomerase [Elusimicrobia bacterium]|nr:D-sedoheptulose 7-phosphate isomerase [Elusimicrobiota bacterium]
MTKHTRRNIVRQVPAERKYTLSAGIAEEIETQLKDSAKTLEKFSSESASQILQAARWSVETYRQGRKLVICGNGGSAADSQHFAAELVGRFKKNRRALPALALTVNTSDLTAIGNDFSFEEVFSRQVQAHVVAGDLLFVLSTSGNSPNVLKAAQEAKRCGARVIGLTGRSGGKLKARVDLCICVPSEATERIQESHIAAIHAICAFVEQALFP